VPPERQGAVAIGDRLLAWHAVGAGPPLLLVNGYAATGRDWDPGFVLALSRHFRVICPDNRGLGGSGLGEGELTVAGMAADLVALLDALAIERATVAGWSMGGFVAQALAARTPARVAGLALLATDPGAPDTVALSAPDWARLTDHGGTPREQATRLLGLLFPPALAPEVDRRFGDVVARGRAALPEATLFAQEAAMDGWHPRGLGEGPAADREAAPLRESESPTGDDSVPAPPFPVAIGHGALDVVIPPGNAGPLARRWAGATVEVFDECAHALMAQEPARAAALVRSVGSAG
jgi:pimeloyl-ACP methyl ester carboxylesterase